jgi:hypothetical protein
MGFDRANLMRWLLLVGMAAASACLCSAQPQDAAQKPGQPILFSSPDNDNVSSNMPSLTPKPLESENLANVVKSPIINLQAALPVAPPPDIQQPRVSPEESKRMKRQQEERDNWSLLTPEQILGLPTKEKVLGVTDQDAAGQPKDESVVVQYYERQQRLRSRTNNYDYRYDSGYDNGPTNGSPQWDISGNRESPMDSNHWPGTGNQQEYSSLLSQFLARTTTNRANSASAEDGGWFGPFNLPARPTGPTPEQKIAMEQFQQLLKPHEPPGGETTVSAPGTTLFSAPPAASSSTLGPLAVTPIGASYTPLGTGLTMPTALAPLSSVPGPNYSLLPALAPAWTPSPPPWQSTAPQLGVMPPRKF